MSEPMHWLQDVDGDGKLGPIFDAMREGVIVRGAAGKIVASNRAAREILGVSAEQLAGHDFESLSMRWLREDGSPFPPGLHAAAITLKAGQAQRNVVLGVRGNGPGTVWVQADSQALTDARGQILGVVTAFEDITRLKAAEAALRETEVRNRTRAEAIAQSGASVIITDRTGRIEYVNPACCKTYGYAESELLGANPRIFKSGETPLEVYALLWDTIVEGRTWRGELSNRARDGRLIREAVSVSPVRDESGEVRHFVAIKEDITQLREDERRRHELFERVARLERMEVVGTLAGGVAHDFNNVLVAILGYSELAETLLTAEGSLPRVADYVGEIRVAGERARELVQQLLHFSRSGPSRVRSSGLREIAAEAVGLLRATLPDTVAVLADVDPSLPLLSVDPAHVHQIMMNLLINARDAVNGHGTIRLVVRRMSIGRAQPCDSCRREFAGDHLVIAVKDDGAGIAAEIRDRLFEPFFTTKEVGRGTGMGLAVVHGMTHLYDGHVRVHSVPGEGAEFEILLPVGLLDPGAIPVR